MLAVPVGLWVDIYNKQGFGGTQELSALNSKTRAGTQGQNQPLAVTPNPCFLPKNPKLQRRGEGCGKPLQATSYFYIAAVKVKSLAVQTPNWT